MSLYLWHFFLELQVYYSHVWLFFRTVSSILNCEFIPHNSEKKKSQVWDINSQLWDVNMELQEKKVRINNSQFWDTDNCLFILYSMGGTKNRIARCKFRGKQKSKAQQSSFFDKPGRASKNAVIFSVIWWIFTDKIQSFHPTNSCNQLKTEQNLHGELYHRRAKLWNKKGHYCFLTVYCAIVN